MKKKQKKYIRYSKDRAILSDVLPYEVPIIFSNRHFYRFLVKNRVELKAGKLHFETKYYDEELNGFKEVLKLLFGVKNIQSNSIADVELRKTPFLYRIAHKESDFRELAIVHPVSQISLIEFYEKYKEQIIYYSKVSQFSIRKPDSVAKFVFFNDKLHVKERGDESDFLELKGREYENLKSFFAYKKYTNIYRFYEDYRYQRAEKKYKILYKFDITKCFDSIYSHSIVWALSNKEIVKYNIAKSKGTFGGQFDYFIQNANSGETNGIVIGPEFSRIFAELILQQVDKNVEQKLRFIEKLYNRRDYELYRYVDDYFLFCNDERIRDCIVKLFRHELKEFKMALNDSKAKLYERPMITEISIAKQRINQLFEKEPIFKIKEKLVKESSEELQEADNEETILGMHLFKFYINPNRLATKFKIIIKDSNVEYKDVLNYTLAILNTKIEKIILKFDERFYEYSKLEMNEELSQSDIIRKKKLELNFAKYVVGYIDFVFFLYSVSPRVNSSIKLSNILAKIIEYYKGFYKTKEGVRYSRMRNSNKDLVFKKIADDISLILDRHQMDKHTQIEVLYLLVILRELGTNYRINQFQLAKYFNSIDKETGVIRIKGSRVLNYFSIVVLFFYMRDIAQYHEFKAELKRYVLEFICDIDKDKRKKNSELVLLVLDLIACPFLDKPFKHDLLKLYSVEENNIDDLLSFTKTQTNWFVKWEKFQFAKELNSKNSEEVYS